MNAEVTHSQPANGITIEPFDNGRHRGQVVALWESVFGYKTPHNRPELSIDRKVELEDSLFWVAVAGEQVVGTTMAGYDGHRGWIYSVAVDAAWRNRGIGTRLVRDAEQALTAKKCVKINLIILAGNEAVTGFYASLGYTVEPRVNMGKLILENIPPVAGRP
jgi:ribosomal protein S18 acetylase RimI-like enzyme